MRRSRSESGPEDTEFTWKAFGRTAEVQVPLAALWRRRGAAGDPVPLAPVPLGATVPPGGGREPARPRPLASGSLGLRLTAVTFRHPPCSCLKR